MPAWLVQWEMDRDPEGWISDAVKWGWVMEALEWSLELLRRVSIVTPIQHTIMFPNLSVHC